MACPEEMSLGAMPTEILVHIFSFLDSSAASNHRLHDQPSADMLMRPDSPQPLKALSLVSRRVRAAVLPLLFRHVAWGFDRWDLMLAEQEADPASAIPLLRFLRDHQLGSYVQSLTLIVGDSINAMYRLRAESRGMPGPSSVRISGGLGQEKAATYNEDNNWLWRVLFEVMDPLRFTIIASPRMLASLLSRMLFLGDAWSFIMPQHILSLSREDRSTATTTMDEGDIGEGSSTSAPAPSTEASSSSSSCTTNQKRIPCILFDIRRWTRLLLNEGSSTSVYKTYEFFLKRPPSMLGALLGAEEFPNDAPLIPPSVRDLSYVGIFPLSSHVETLAQHLPRIDRLFVQLVPRNDILTDPDEMRNIDVNDLWMERNSSYQHLMRELFDPTTNASAGGGNGNGNGNWALLREFESGDAADREAWEMAVQYIRLSEGDWRVERDGVFVRRDDDDDDDGGDDSRHISVQPLHAHNDAEDFEAGFSDDERDSEDSGEGGATPLTFVLVTSFSPPICLPSVTTTFIILKATLILRPSQGRLRRIAFNGTARLPLSSMWLYVTPVDQ